MDRVLVFEDLRAAFHSVLARPDGKATADDMHTLRSIIGNATAIDLRSTLRRSSTRQYNTTSRH